MALAWGYAMARHRLALVYNGAKVYTHKISLKLMKPTDLDLHCLPLSM